jgi:hypothetical protein
VTRADNRDRAVEQLLRQSFATPQDAAIGSCLDAEVIAAWVDGDLAGHALETAQAHVTGCVRCRTIVGAMARTGSVVGREPEPARRRWFAWAVPLTAAATAVTLWVALPWESRDPETVTDRLAQASGAKIEEPESFRGQPAPAVPEEIEQRAQMKPDSPRQGGEEERGSRRDNNRLEADRQERAAAGVGNAASTDSSNPAASAPASPPAPPRDREQLQAAQRVAAAEAMPFSGIVVASSDASIGWRLGGSVVERTANGGVTWAPVLTEAGLELTAGSSPSPLVCWIVGRGGVVLLSIDGRTFSRVAFPEQADLTAVQATDARSASVSTADRRTFMTTDGGLTWRPRAPVP